MCSRKHIFLDLQPYVCTYAECTLGEYLFEDEQEWYRHEAQNHRYHWFCNVEGHETFETADTFIVHMKSSHQQDVGKHELHALQHTFQRPASTQAGVCPLCFEATQKIKSHIARHLKQLALFAIPQTDFMALSDTDDDGGSDRANRSDPAIHLAQFGSQVSNDSSGFSSESVGRSNSGADHSPEESIDPLVFDDTSIPSRPGDTAQDTSWDYVTPKFREAREHEQTNNQNRDSNVDPSQKLVTESPIPQLNLIQSSPPGSQADFTGTRPEDEVSGGEPQTLSWDDIPSHLSQEDITQNISSKDAVSNSPEVSVTSTQEQAGPSHQTSDSNHETATDIQAPQLNLIQPTPPGSDVDATETVSRPPSPTFEHAQDSGENIQEGRGSQVSWGENQYHSYEVSVPGEYNPDLETINTRISEKDNDEFIYCRDSDSDLETNNTTMSKKDKRKSKAAEEAEREAREPKDETIDSKHERIDPDLVSQTKSPLADGFKVGQRHMMNPHYQQRPVCGASIGAFRGQHLPTVSLGGIILVDGEAYGLTVHNMLDAPSDDESETEDEEQTSKDGPSTGRTSPPTKNPWIKQVLDTKQPVEDAVTSSKSQASQVTKDSADPDRAHSETLPLFDSNTELESDVPDLDKNPGYGEGSGEDFANQRVVYTPGDIPGIAPGEGKDIIMTQPAIDDLEEDFFPSEEHKDEDHLECHRLGYIYASSGIRRVVRDGVVHEIDWALIKIDPERLQTYNVVQGGRRFSSHPEPHDPPPLLKPLRRVHYRPEEDEYPMEVAPRYDLGGLQVHSFGRTTGLQGGKIGPAMASVRIYGRNSYSRSWYIQDADCKFPINAFSSNVFQF